MEKYFLLFPCSTGNLNCKVTHHEGSAESSWGGLYSFGVQVFCRFITLFMYSPSQRGITHEKILLKIVRQSLKYSFFHSLHNPHVIFHIRYEYIRVGNSEIVMLPAVRVEGWGGKGRPSRVVILQFVGINLCCISGMDCMGKIIIDTAVSSA